MLKVLHIVPNMNRGGLETFIMNVYRQIDRKKIQFDFLEHYKQESAYDKEIIKLGGKIYHFALRNDNNIINYIIALNAFFKKHPEYKIVHCHMESIGFIVFKIAQKYGISVRIGHAHTNSTTKDIKGYIKNLTSRLFKYTTTYNLACSKKAGDYLFKKHPYHILNNSIDFKKFSFSEEKRKKIRQELQISNDTFVIGHVGRIDKIKNQLFLLEIFSKYLQKNPHSLLILVGTGAWEEKIKNRILELQINDKVKILNPRNDVDYLYQGFDIFVFPSIFEGLGMVLVEAQASGLPILASDTIPKEVVISDKITFLNLNNLEEWVKTIEQIKISDRNVDIFNKDKFDIQVITKYLENLYLNSVN